MKTTVSFAVKAPSFAKVENVFQIISVVMEPWIVTMRVMSITVNQTHPPTPAAFVAMNSGSVTMASV